jgi:hypothetical protein
LSFTRANKIVAAAEQLAIPAMYFRREFALVGGLMSYGTNTDENFQVMGEYTGRILKGEKPSDLPIQQPTSFEFVINLKTAKAPQNHSITSVAMARIPGGMVRPSGGAAVWPFAARAQQGDRIRRIGVLIGGNENDPLTKARLSTFTQALADLGWTDGRNVRIDLRWGRRDANRVQALAQELVGLQPDVIVTGTTAATVAVQRGCKKRKNPHKMRVSEGSVLKSVTNRCGLEFTPSRRGRIECPDRRRAGDRRGALAGPLPRNRLAPPARRSDRQVRSLSRGKPLGARNPHEMGTTLPNRRPRHAG